MYGLQYKSNWTQCYSAHLAMPHGCLAMASLNTALGNCQTFSTTNFHENIWFHFPIDYFIQLLQYLFVHSNSIVYVNSHSCPFNFLVSFQNPVILLHCIVQPPLFDTVVRTISCKYILYVWMLLELSYLAIQLGM